MYKETFILFACTCIVSTNLAEFYNIDEELQAIESSKHSIGLPKKLGKVLILDTAAPESVLESDEKTTLQTTPDYQNKDKLLDLINHSIGFLANLDKAFIADTVAAESVLENDDSTMNPTTPDYQIKKKLFDLSKPLISSKEEESKDHD